MGGWVDGVGVAGVDEAKKRGKEKRRGGEELDLEGRVEFMSL